MDINSVLEKAPSAIASYTMKENEAYASMLKLHEEYKRLWAKMYLEKKASEEKISIKEIECVLEIDKDLSALKDRELVAEIEYRSWRQKKDNAKDHFVAAQEIARTRRTELKSLHDTV
jgi:hypothetical protein